MDLRTSFYQIEALLCQHAAGTANRQQCATSLPVSIFECVEDPESRGCFQHKVVLRAKMGRRRRGLPPPSVDPFGKRTGMTAASGDEEVGLANSVQRPAPRIGVFW